jgi:hypothetical protein
VPLLVDLGGEVDLTAKERLVLTVSLVAARKERRRVVDIVVAKWPNLEAGHRRRTIAL